MRFRKPSSPRFGRINILVNNAGVRDVYPVKDLPLGSWQRTLDINLTATFLPAREQPRTCAQGKGDRQHRVDRCGARVLRIATRDRDEASFVNGVTMTGDLATRDPEAALTRATARDVDRGSGTRIGASLKEFNDLYDRRALSRGAAIVIVSDDWDREGPQTVGREMARLTRGAYAVVWVNPLRPIPTTSHWREGMRAALPFIDRVLSGHNNLRSLDGLAAVVSGIERRHAA